MNRRRFVGQVAVAAVVLQTGCMNTDPTNETQEDGGPDADNRTMNETNTTGSDEATALYPPLPGLITAENRTAYAAEHDLQYEEGAVSVEVLLAGEEQPSEYMTDIDGQYGELLRGTVAVEELRPLANDSRVRAVRRPAQPQPTGQ